jgi:PPM family protein phosphatase
MKFNISAFTHVGTMRKSNQDNILVNGLILNKGELHLTGQNECICYVADGVGGNNAGEFASHFILEKLKSETDFNSPEIDRKLHEINELLLTESHAKNELTGTATTLTGLIITDSTFKVIHAGDSKLWLLRDDMFFQITNDQVFNEAEVNSAISSYFGGNENYLKLDDEISIHESLPDDIFLICSDGLYKSLNHKIVKSILKAEKELVTKSKKILEDCLLTGAEDNFSVILINQTL